MIWGLLIRPSFYRALARDARDAFMVSMRGPYCRVTREHVHPQHRVAHEHNEHPTDGPCVLL